MLLNSNVMEDENFFICVYSMMTLETLQGTKNIDSNACLELFVKFMTTNKIYCLASYISNA